MYERYYTIAACLLILAGSLHAKQKDDRKQNHDFNMGNSNGGWDNIPSKTSEMIDIDDNPPQSDVYMGSGDQQVDDDYYSGDGLDDEDSEGSAGPNVDEEDASAGSGAGMYKSPCQKLKAELEVHQVVGTYVPKCTNDGAFEKMQCSGSTGECWCVDEMGREISDTKRQHSTDRPDCDNMHPVVISRPQPESPGLEPGHPQEEPLPESKEEEQELDNHIDNMPGVDGINPSVEIQTVPPETNNVMMESKGSNMIANNVVMTQPGILAGIIGGAVVGLLCAVLLVMFIVYRMRKKDEGSYALDEPRRSPSLHTYSRATNREFYA